MAIKYCDWVTGDDLIGDGSAGNPYKTITTASTGLIAGDEVRVGKSPDVTALSGTIAWVQGDHTFVTSADLTGELSQGDFISKGIGWPWGETLYEVNNIGVDFVEVYAVYPGTTETVASFKIETTDTDTDPASTDKVQELMSSGALGSVIKLSGGWDLTTETKIGHTYFRQVHTTFSHRYGYGLWSAQKYVEISGLSFLRYRYGLRFNSASNTELTGAHLNSNGSYGLYIYNMSTLVTNQVLCAGNFGYGAYMYSLTVSSLSSLRSYSNQSAGAYLYNSHNNSFISLRMSFNVSYGLYARYSEGNIFSAPTVSDNGNHGLYLYYMSINRFTNLLVINNNRGIYLYKSFENIFTTTQIDDHSVGVYSYQSFGNRLYNLSMQGNTDDFYIYGRGKSEVPVFEVGRYQEDNLDLWYFDDGHCETCRNYPYFLDVESIKFHSTSNSEYIYHSWFVKVCKGDARRVSIWMRDDAIHHPTVYGTLYFKEKAVNSATLLDLSVPGWHKFEFIPTTSNWIIDSGFLELRIQVTGSCDCWADKFSAYTSEDVMQYLVEMRGEDDDTLKTLSDQLDVVQDDLDTPDQYKANVAPLALEDGGRIEETQNHIKHAEYGLQALKAIFDEIKGAGWSDESLVSLSETLEWVLSATAIRVVTVGAGATATLFTTDLTETMDDFWSRGALVFITGQCTGQMRKIHDYVGGTKQITLYTPLSYAPAVDDTFLIITERNFRTNIADNNLIADTVWNEFESEHTAAGSFGKKVGRLTLDDDDNIHAVIKDAGTVPEDVWKEHTYDHTDPDTFGYTNQHQVPSEDINDYKDAMTEGELHTGLDSYTNKDDYKASVPDIVTAIQTSEDNIRGSDGDTLETLSDQIDAVKTGTDQIITDVQFIKDIEGGRWYIDTGQKQMVFCALDGSEVARFNLLDADGQPAIENVMERVPV